MKLSYVKLSYVKLAYYKTYVSFEELVLTLNDYSLSGSFYKFIEYIANLILLYIMRLQVYIYIDPQKHVLLITCERLNIFDNSYCNTLINIRIVHKCKRRWVVITDEYFSIILFAMSRLYIFENVVQSWLLFIHPSMVPFALSRQ